MLLKYEFKSSSPSPGCMGSAELTADIRTSNIFYRSIIRASLLSFWELVCRFPTCAETGVTTFAVWNGALKWLNRETAEWISYLEGESLPLERQTDTDDTEEKHSFHTSSYLPLPGKQLFYNVGIKCQFLGGKQLSVWSKFFVSIRSDSLRSFKELITTLLFLSRKKKTPRTPQHCAEQIQLLFTWYKPLHNLLCRSTGSVLGMKILSPLNYISVVWTVELISAVSFNSIFFPLPSLLSCLESSLKVALAKA